MVINDLIELAAENVGDRDRAVDADQDMNHHDSLFDD
jgi:hypothetical protein